MSDSDIATPQPPRTYARIDGGLVAELFSTSLNVSSLFVPSITWIDVTGATPQPDVGWTYTAGTASAAPTFAAPVVVPVTVIPAPVFLARFTASELTSIATAAVSTPAILGWYVSLMSAGATVDLTSAALKGTLDALVTADALASDRETAALATS